MTAIEADDPTPAKKGKGPLLIGLVLALAGAGGGFFATSSGLLPFGAADAATENGGSSSDAGSASAEDGAETGSSAKVGFVPLDPLIVNLSSSDGQTYLRFTAQIEVPKGREDDVTSVMPRIVDVLNGYLRAMSADELNDPTILHRLRGQMLRRIQIVTGPDVARDLLIMEFVLN